MIVTTNNNCMVMTCNRLALTLFIPKSEKEYGKQKLCCSFLKGLILSKKLNHKELPNLYLVNEFPHLKVIFSTCILIFTDSSCKSGSHYSLSPSVNK